MSEARYRDLEAIGAEYDCHGPAIRTRLEEFAAVRENEYFYELVYCLLTPQSSAANAGQAVERLRMAGDKVDARVVASILADRRHYIRFHNTKARNICEARAAIDGILQQLRSSADGDAARFWLVRNVRGLGWKEASHFLRNVGRRDLAILDRHILRNLKRHGVIRSIPGSLTPKRYRAIEKQFRKFAAAVKIPMDELDLLFWRRETGRIMK
jgi:N-glycosylase/DNA lyase